MAKLPERDDDTLFEGDWLTIRAMSRRNGKMPAAEWYDSLNDKGKGQFLAAARTVETTLQSGRPPAGRAEQVKISKQGLWELKITKPGSSAPHLRMLFKREGTTLWAAVGFTKQKNRLEKGDAQLGDSVTEEWLATREGR